METLTYLLKVTACTVLFFSFYLLFLQRLTFFKINRFYLLGSLLLSFVIPAMQFEVKREITVVETAIPASVPEWKPVSTAPVQLIQPVVVEYDQEEATELDWPGLISYAYAGIALLLLLICLWRLFNLLRHTRGYSKNNDGLKLITKTKGFTNCSFFNYVFIDTGKLSDTNLAVLLKHEQVHARQFHSADKILLMIARALLWFNPVIYLYDKALEQVHEYEADEITSASFGNQAYASLLLQLAVTKTNNALIHNFVKSPVKARIKMLFHSKSKNMKKWMYLLTLPFAVGLFWLFAVQIVYAQRVVEESKPAQDFFQGTLTGKVLNIKKEPIGFYTFDLFSNGKIYPIEATAFKDKIKVGDELIAYVSAKGFNMKKMDKSGKVIAETKEPIYNVAKVTTLTGSLIYEQKIEDHAFLFEANKARSALTKIKSIEKSDHNQIEKIVLNNGAFTIILNLKAQNIRDENFKAGDQVLVKFIGEKLVSKNTYTTDKMIVLYSQPKKYLIKNVALYNRFYLIDGKQKIAAVKDAPVVVSEVASPKIISFSKITGDVRNKTTYMNDAVMDVLNYKLEARNIEFDQANNRIIANDGILKSLDGRSITTASSFDLDLNKGVFKMGHGNGELWADKLTNADYKKEDLLSAKDKIEYRAGDSVRFSKDKSIVYLFGNAELRYNKLVVNGRKIIYNKNNNTVLVNDATMMSDDNKEVKKEVLYFNLKTAETHE